VSQAPPTQPASSDSRSTEATLYPAVDLELARRLERAEAAANAAFVEARGELDPALGATWIEVAGVYAMFDGADSPLTQTFGLGLFDAFLAPEYDSVEAFFGERGAPTFHEVSSFAARDSQRLLDTRGYVPIEGSIVLIRPTGLPSSPYSGEITVRLIDESESALWARVAAEGWSSESVELASFVENLGIVISRSRGVFCFLAEAGNEPIAAAALNMSTNVALLAGASTTPAHRKRGAQQALLQARLSFAVDRGIDLAMLVAQPGSASCRNAERQGFRPVYSRTKWQLNTADA
jgi:GNAT superfamily N-acetyltransferase